MNLRKFGLVFILCAALAACSAGGDGTPTTAPTLSPSAVATGAPGMTRVAPTAASTPPAPTAVPTPAQGRVILVSPDENKKLNDALAGLAAGSGWAFETRPALKAEEILPSTKVVVFLQAPADLPALRAAAPQAQFVVAGGASGDSALEAGGNLSVIRQPEEQRAFLAGYITTIIAPDWRAAGLLPDAPSGLQDAFINGGRYWCGRCVPMYAPLVLFPLAGVRPAGTDAAGWQGALQELQAKVLEAVYISPEAAGPDLLKTLSGQKLILVGAQPPPADAKPRWAATLSFDLVAAIQKLWPDLAAGKGGLAAAAGLSWTDVNVDIFTVGKQRLAKEVLDGLLDGTISPFSVPAQ